MQALASIKAATMENIGNILACRNRNTSGKFNCIQQIITQPGLQHWGICIHQTKNAAFTKQQTEGKPGSKLYLLMIQQEVLTSISILIIQTNCMQPCGAKPGVHGSFVKAAQAAAFIKAQ